MRKLKFANGEYYHIYNRGVDKRTVFLDENDYLRFLKSLREFNVCRVDGGLYRKFLREREVVNRGSASNLEAEPLNESEAEPLNDHLVDFICYCLNPNHFHLILRQLTEDGIVKFMQRLGTAYTMYFNTKYKRSGVLFQGKFKAIEIQSNEDLLWVSTYVNANAQIHGLIKDASQYKWCSFLEYLGLRKENLCNKNVILDQFRSPEAYKDAAEECLLKMKKDKDLQKYLID